MQIQNPDATDIIRQEAGLTLAEGFPQNLTTNVVPVMDMTPSFHRQTQIATASRTATGSTTILTLSQQKRTYVTGVLLQSESDATSDCIEITVTGKSVTGAAVKLAFIRKLASSAGNYSQVVDFPFPIEIDKTGGTISLNQSYSTGNTSSQATVLYYETS